MTMETTNPRSSGFWGKIGAGLLVIYATLIRGFIFWFERTRLHAVRVSVKTLWLFLTLWILFFALLPLEVESWQLWMTNKELAKNLAIAVVITCFLVVEMGRIAFEAKRPWAGRTAYGLAVICTVLAILSGWNYLMHSAETMRGGGTAQAERSAEMLKQAQEDLAKHDTATAERLAILNASLQKADAGWAPTGTSRLNQSITDYEKQSTTERRELVRRVEAARSQAVVAHVDPRPIDIVLGNILFKGDAINAGIAIDLLRVAFFKFFVLFGLSLTFTPAPESAKKQEKEKLAAERARAMQGADGKFKPRRQVGLPQSDTDNNSDWVAPEARVEKPKKAKSTKKGKRWLDDVFAKKAAENAEIEDAQFTEEPVELRAKDADFVDGLSEGEQNPQSEVSDESVSGEDRQGEAEAGSGAGILPADVGLLDLAGADSDSAETPDAPEGNEAVWLGEGPTADATPESEILTHAEEDQQAEQEETGADSDGLASAEANEQSSEDERISLSRDDEFSDVSERDFDAANGEAVFDPAAVEALAEDLDAPANDGSETPLPNGEGVLVRAAE